MGKYNLQDVTFVFPVKIDSQERLCNTLTLYKYLLMNFNTHFIFCEANAEPTQQLSTIPGYYYIKDDKTVFHHTYYRNQMIKKSKTPIIGIWDVDILVPIVQIIAAVDAIRNNGYSMAWPYSGICYDISMEDSHIFRKELEIKFVENNSIHYRKMYGRLSTGGAFFVNKEDYIEIGLENEYIYGWGPEDIERLKRASILNYPIIRIKGDSYHLFHPRYVNSRYANLEIKLNNINELLRICNLSVIELKNEIKTWKWVRKS